MHEKPIHMLTVRGVLRSGKKRSALVCQEKMPQVHGETSSITELKASMTALTWPSNSAYTVQYMLFASSIDVIPRMYCNPVKKGYPFEQQAEVRSIFSIRLARSLRNYVPFTGFVRNTIEPHKVMQASTGSEDPKIVEPRIMSGVHGID